MLSRPTGPGVRFDAARRYGAAFDDEGPTWRRRKGLPESFVVEGGQSTFYPAGPRAHARVGGWTSPDAAFARDLRRRRAR